VPNEVTTASPTVPAGLPPPVAEEENPVLVIAHGASGLGSDYEGAVARPVSPVRAAKRLRLRVKSLEPRMPGGLLELSTDPDELQGTVRSAYLLGGWPLVVEIYEPFRNEHWIRVETATKFGRKVAPYDGVAGEIAVEYREQAIAYRPELIQLERAVERATRELIVERLEQSKRQVELEALRYFELDAGRFRDLPSDRPDLGLLPAPSLRRNSPDVQGLRAELQRIAKLTAVLREYQELLDKPMGEYPAEEEIAEFVKVSAKKDEADARRTQLVANAVRSYPTLAWMWDADNPSDEPLGERIRIELEATWQAAAKVREKVSQSLAPPEADPVLLEGPRSTRIQDLHWFPLDPMTPYARLTKPRSTIEWLAGVPESAGVWHYRRMLAEALQIMGQQPPSAANNVAAAVLGRPGWTAGDSLSLAGPLAAGLCFGPLGAMAASAVYALGTLTEEWLKKARNDIDYRAVLDPAEALIDPPSYARVLWALVGMVASVAPGRTAFLVDLASGVVLAEED
jgi:hypothetical protein